MKILIFNWRDFKHPSSGGAEILTHEIAKKWVKNGHQVTLFSSFFRGAKKHEEIEGISIIRSGEADIRHLVKSVHWHAFLQYRNSFMGKFDIVVDEFHGIPFFTPLYVKEKKVVLICEVAGDLWESMFGSIVGRLGKIVEKFSLKYMYQHIHFLTISQSAREDLIKNGVKNENITLLKVGVEKPTGLHKLKKEKNPTLIFLGRISPAKGIEDALLAFKLICSSYPKARMWIVGRGDKQYIEQIVKFAESINIYDRIFFWGYVPEEEKYNLLSKAWILIHPSKSEGWGINVIEANSVGTPAVGYNVSGLKDSIQHRKTGLLTDSNTPQFLANAAISLIQNKTFYKTLSVHAEAWAKNFSWAETAEKSLASIKTIYEQ